MKKINILLIFVILLFSLATSQAKAVDGGVSFKMNVLAPKPTDTINDFAWSGQAESTVPLKEVKGISTVNSNYVVQTDIQNPKNAKTINPYLLAFSPVYAIYYLVTVLIN